MEHTAAPMPDEGCNLRGRSRAMPGGEGGGSRGQGGWDEVSVDFRCHDSCPEVFGLALTKGRLHVEIEKGMKEDECEKGHEAGQPLTRKARRLIFRRPL